MEEIQVKLVELEPWVRDLVVSRQHSPISLNLSILMVDASMNPRIFEVRVWELLQAFVAVVGPLTVFLELLLKFLACEMLLLIDAQLELSFDVALELVFVCHFQQQHMRRRTEPNSKFDQPIDSGM